MSLRVVPVPMLSPQEGNTLLGLARTTLERSLRGPPPTDPAAWVSRLDLPKSFGEPRGTFVTLRTAQDDALRGCIGFPTPVYPLMHAVPRAAYAAAVEDPRFPPVEAEELGGLRIEVSVLTVPEPFLEPARASLPDHVEVGRDGLIVERGRLGGLLLPQVASEQGWGAEEFLDQTCVKAGLPPGAWRAPSVRVLRFRSEVFQEPPGPVGPHRRIT